MISGEGNVRRRIMHITTALVSAAFVAALSSTAATAATSSAVTLNRAVHFTAPDGSAVQVPPGRYELEQPAVM